MCEFPASPDTGAPTSANDPVSAQVSTMSARSGSSGLTAGASAPEELVRHVIEALSKIEDVEVEQMDGKKEHIEFRLPAELRA